MNLTIMKIARIETFELSEETVKYIDDNFKAAWHDDAGGEDIHDINAQLEEVSHSKIIPSEVRKELEEVQRLVNDNECSGFMITY
jgi:hypothetical protein